MAAKISVGPSPDIGVSGWSANYTTINMDNPCARAGKIKIVELWVKDATLTGVEVATFYSVDGDTFTTRDSTPLDDMAAGYASFVVDLDVEVGDYIGIFYSGGTLYQRDAGYAGIYYKAGDQIPCEGVQFTAYTGALSLYGQGDGDLDVGIVAQDYTIVQGPGLTRINVRNPVNAAGTIKKVKIYTDSELSDVDVAIFYRDDPGYYASGDFSTRSWAVLGTVPVGYSEHNVSLAAEVGDLIGLYWSAGDIDSYTGGVGGITVDKAGDQIPCSGVGFLILGSSIALWGEGPEAAPPAPKPYTPHCGPRKKKVDFFPTLKLRG